LDSPREGKPHSIVSEHPIAGDMRSRMNQHRMPKAPHSRLSEDLGVFQFCRSRKVKTELMGETFEGKNDFQPASPEELHVTVEKCLL
jgi:hypothetical protein